MRAVLIRAWLLLSVLWVSFGGAVAFVDDPLSAGLGDKFVSLESGVAQINPTPPPIQYDRLVLYFIFLFCPPAFLWVLGGSARCIIYGGGKSKGQSTDRETVR